MLKIRLWNQFARSVRLGARQIRPEDLLRHPRVAEAYPWLAGWVMNDLGVRTEEVMPGCSLVSLPFEQFPATAGHEINLSAITATVRPALRRHTFEDVYLMVYASRLCIFRPGEVYAGSNALVVDESIADSIANPDFHVEEGAYCGGHNPPNNPAHLLCDHLPRGVILRDLVGLPPDSLWLDTGESPYAEYAAAAVLPGFSRLAPGACYHFGKLHLLSSSFAYRGHPFWFMNEQLYRGVRDCLIAGLPRPAGGVGRDVYLARFDTARRPLVNERELTERLADQGFEVHTMSSLSPAEQLSLVRDARRIVAPHGGALGNLVVLSRGARVLELFNPRKGTACFAALARGADARHEAIFGTPRETEARHSWEVDIDAVMRQIETL